MPPVDGNPSVSFNRLRVGRLGATGDVMVGATNGFVSGSQIELADTPDIERGIEITQRNGAGELCVEYRDPDVVKRRNLTLSICGVEDELFELITGALLIQNATPATIGHADPPLGEVPNPNGISIEGWSKNLVNGSQSPTLPWFRWLYGKTYGWTRGEDRLLHGQKAWTFTGIAVENPALRADGPFSDWDGPVDRVRAVYRTADAPPAAGIGYVAVPA